MHNCTNFISIFTILDGYNKQSSPIPINDLNELIKLSNINKYSHHIQLYDFALKTIRHYPILLFPIHREDVSEYEQWFKWLINRHAENTAPQISAIYLPYVSGIQLIDSALSLCGIIRSLLLINESDFYDYIMSQ